MELKILFYMFSLFLCASACVVIFSKNTIYAVLSLIVAFFNTAGLFLITGAEFLALSLIIVYVGAVAVLFLFVVMMLDMRNKEPIFSLLGYKIAAFLSMGVLLGELITVSLKWQSIIKALDLIRLPIDAHVTNTHAIGRVIYTNYFFVFQIAGMILLVAMIGAIVLTLGQKSPSQLKKQKIKAQISRTPQNTLVIAKVVSGEGTHPGIIIKKDS